MKLLMLLFIFLISCTPVVQEAVTKPRIETQPEPKVAPPPVVLEPETKAPQEVAPPAPVPKPQLPPEEECIQNCEENCAATSQNSCTQKERSGCKGICDDNQVIDPAACTQACTYLNQPNVCKQQMEQFCSANCIGYCH